jgi:hypothetical protein
VKSQKNLFNSLIIGISTACYIVFFYSCNINSNKQEKNLEQHDYTVAAYVWPSCHDEPMSREALWGEGIGEWEIIKKAYPLFEGHYQPRIPLWGYQMDDDPKAWEKKIKAATDNGLNTFIFDWYWYDGEPFLEEALNEGFLGAGNNKDMKFYIMWANHGANGKQWNRLKFEKDTILWPGTVDWDNYKIIVQRVIDQYFNQSNYYKIDDKPVFSICSLSDLVKSFDGLDGTMKALNYFKDEVKKAGFPDLHIQLVVWEFSDNQKPHLLGDHYMQGRSINEVISYLNINSVTSYHWPGPLVEDYIAWGQRGLDLEQKWDSLLSVPYFANVSMGYDDTPRFLGKGTCSVIKYNNSPESFAAFLQKAKEYADNHPEQPKLITINAWNEWVEGSYLEPDMKWGYGYLEALKKVIIDQKYSKFADRR